MKKDTGDRAQIERLSAFSDNIIAFALTLLALDLTVFKKGLGSVLAFGDLTNLFHPFAAFILSFIVVGTLWRIYAELFGFIIKIDPTIIVANLLLLFFIVIVPFSASLVSSYFGQTVSTFGYSLNALMLALCLNYMVVYIEHHPLYLHEDIDKGKMRTFRISCNVGIINKPCKAVLDYFKLDDVTLIGYSLGGCLAVRAAAFESRINRVICDDIVSDFREFPFRTLAPVARTVVSTLLKLGASSLLNPLINSKMKKNLEAEWGVKQGMHTLGAKDPYKFFMKTGAFETLSVSHLVKQDVLLFAGSKDHYVPLHQFYDQIQTLKNVRSLTARLFTEKEQAQNHCQVGNAELSLQTIVRWIKGLVEREVELV